METKQKNAKKTVIALAVLLVAIATLLCIYHFTKGSTAAGAKNITVEVIHGDGSEKSFEYATNREYLGEVLTDNQLVEGENGAYGIFIKTVDGETVNDANQEWWCITKEGEQLNTSADQTPIADGEKYELTLTVGY